MNFRFKNNILSLLTLIICFSLFLSGCVNERLKDTIKIHSSTGRYQLIDSFSPHISASFNSGSVIVVSVKSKFDNLSVTAEFNSEIIELYLSKNNEDQSNNYINSFTL